MFRLTSDGLTIWFDFPPHARKLTIQLVDRTIIDRSTTGAQTNLAHHLARRSTARATRAGATGTTGTTGAAVLDTTILSIVSSRSHRAALGGVHGKGDPSEDTVRDRVTQKNVFDKGIDDVGLLGKDAVLVISSELLRVGRVGRELFDGRDEVLIEENLADMSGVRGVEGLEGVVGVDGGFVEGVG